MMSICSPATELNDDLHAVGKFELGDGGAEQSYRPRDLN